MMTPTIRNIGSITMVLFLSLSLLLQAPKANAQSTGKTYVIVHGAWGGSWAFKNADSILTSKGNLVYRPSLTGQGERVHLATPDVDLNTHIKDVVNTILFEDLNDIILVGHSYGGMVITGVADSLPNRIEKLIYLDAFVPNNGESAFTAQGQNSNPGIEKMTKNGFIVPPWVKDEDPLPKDVPQSLKTFTQPITLKGRAKNLPTAYILTVDEGKKPEEDDFARFAERAKQRGWPVEILISDHNPQWSKVAELCDLLQKLSE